MSRQAEYRGQSEGPENHDPTRHELSAGMQSRPKTLREEFQRYVRQELAQQAYEQGYGDFEDEDNFNIGDEEGDLDWASIHEMREMEDEIQEGGMRETLDGTGDGDTGDFGIEGEGEIQKISESEKETFENAGAEEKG